MIIKSNTKVFEILRYNRYLMYFKKSNNRYSYFHDAQLILKCTEIAQTKDFKEKLIQQNDLFLILYVDKNKFFTVVLITRSGNTRFDNFECF